LAEHELQFLRHRHRFEKELLEAILEKNSSEFTKIYEKSSKTAKEREVHGTIPPDCQRRCFFTTGLC
jgi:hypothetical protein